MDGKFELCSGCRGVLASKSACTRFRCPTPTVCNDKHQMMVCSNFECQRCTHVDCEKQEIASKAMNNPHYLYYCFDCRSNRVRYRLLQESGRHRINREEVRKVLPLPKKRLVENYRYAYAEYYKDINELLAEVKLEPLVFNKEKLVELMKAVKDRKIPLAALSRTTAEDEADAEKKSADSERKILPRYRRIKKN